MIHAAGPRTPPLRLRGPLPHIAPVPPYIRSALRVGVAELRRNLRAMREEMRSAMRSGGVDELRARFPELYFRHVVLPRRQLLQRMIVATVAGKVKELKREAARRGVGPIRLDASALAGVVARDILHAPRGRQRWRMDQPTWPRDEWIRHTFFSSLSQWLRMGAGGDRDIHAAIGGRIGKALARRLARAAITYGAVRIGEGVKRARIEERFRKIAYPWGEETKTHRTPRQILDAAMDTIVVARSEYYAQVAFRDAMREAEAALARAMKGMVPQIIGWRWVLSPAHPDAPSSPDECDAYAAADVGHPVGPGVYWDDLFPESHPNCWCSIIAVWAEPGKKFKYVEPPPDYKARVVKLVKTYRGGDMLAH